MGDLKDIGQKIKGKAQQIQGEINQERGEGLKGGIQKLKGKANEAIADAKLKARQAKREDDMDSTTKSW